MDDTFSARLRAARQRRGLTQAAVALALGLQHATISKWENGRSEPTLERLASLCALLSVSADHLVRGRA